MKYRVKLKKSGRYMVQKKIIFWININDFEYESTANSIMDHLIRINKRKIASKIGFLNN